MPETKKDEPAKPESAKLNTTTTTAKTTDAAPIAQPTVETIASREARLADLKEKEARRDEVKSEIPAPDAQTPQQRAAMQSLDAENRPRGQSAILQDQAKIQPGVANKAAADTAKASPSAGESAQPGPLSGPDVNPPTNPDLDTVFPGPDQNLHGLPALPVDARHPAAATQAATRPTANPGDTGGGAPFTRPAEDLLKARQDFQRLEARAKGANV